MLLLPALAGVAFGASLAAGAAAPRGSRLPDAERAQCAARHGRVERGGMMGYEFCVFTHPDAGRRCTSGSQCAGDCLFADSGPRPPPGARVVGRCEPTTNHFGCRTTVEKGRIAGGICVD